MCNVKIIFNLINKECWGSDSLTRGYRPYIYGIFASKSNPQSFLKWPPFYRRHFQMKFLLWILLYFVSNFTEIVLYFDSNFTEIYSQGSI